MEKKKEKKDTTIVITPANVNDLAARLSFMFNSRVGPVPLLEFYPTAERPYAEEDECSISVRIASPITMFNMKLTNEQVKELLRQGLEATESWVSILRTDMLRLSTKDGSDPRMNKPEEITITVLRTDEEPPF